MALGMVDYSAPGGTDNLTPQVMTQPVNTMAVPPTGLIGSEQALNQGANDYAKYTLGGATSDLNSLGAANQAATGYLPQINNMAPMEAAGVNFTPDTTLSQDVTNPLNQASDQYSGYVSSGQNAQKMQADLMGLNGPQAQQAAQSMMQSNPAFAYQMEQMNKAVQQSAAARGGALGGNVLQELQRNAQGLAAQDWQNQYNNIGNISTTGLNAANAVSGLRSNQANIAGNLQQTGINAKLNAAIADANAKNQMTMANQQQKTQVLTQLADLANQYGINVAGLKSSTGNALAQNASNLGLNLAAGRTTAGQNIAQNASNVASQISSLLNNQGVNISNEMSSDINNMSKILAEYGLNDQATNQNLATIIANITGGQASNTMNAYTQIGQANAAGVMGVNNALQQGLTNAIALGALKTKPPSYNPAASTSVGTINTGSQFGNLA